MTTTSLISRGSEYVRRDSRWADALDGEWPTRGVPSDAWIILNYACDARCVSCHIEGLAPRRKPTEEIILQIKEARRVCRGDRIGFSGGEPTIHSDLVLIIREARRLGFRRVHLYTHGRRLADFALAGQLAEAGLTSAQVSVQGFTEAISDRFMRTEGLALTWRGIANLGHFGVQTTVNTVATTMNLGEIPRIYDLVLARADTLPIIEYRVTYPIIQREMLRNAELLPSITSVVDVVECLVGRQGSVQVRTELIPLCQLRGQAEISVEWAYRNQVDYMIDLNHFESARAWTRECLSCGNRAYCTGLQEQYVRRFGAPRLVPVPR